MKDTAVLASMLAGLQSIGGGLGRSYGPDGTRPDSERVRERRRRKNERRRRQIERGALRPNCQDEELWGDRE